MSITVCITCFNQEQFLAEALDSVLAQTRRPDEIVIVDDASTDGSRALITAYSGKHRGFVPVLLPRNVGVAAARNEALRRATSDLVTFLDGDDRYLPEKLEHESAALEKDDSIQFVFSDVNYIDESGKFVTRWAAAGRPTEGDVFVPVFARCFPRGNLFRSEMVRTAAWRRVGCFDENLRNLYEDFDMRIRLAHELRCRFVDVPLSDYRLHGSGLSRAGFEEHYMAFRYIFDKNAKLLVDRSVAERKLVCRRFRGYLSRFAWRAARAGFGRKKFIAAARYGCAAAVYRIAAIAAIAAGR